MPRQIEQTTIDYPLDHARQAVNRGLTGRRNGSEILNVDGVGPVRFMSAVRRCQRKLLILRWISTLFGGLGLQRTRRARALSHWAEGCQGLLGRRPRATMSTPVWPRRSGPAPASRSRIISRLAFGEVDRLRQGRISCCTIATRFSSYGWLVVAARPASTTKADKTPVVSPRAAQTGLAQFGDYARRPW
jgi:hypothetical protein